MQIKFQLNYSKSIEDPSNIISSLSPSYAEDYATYYNEGFYIQDVLSNNPPVSKRPQVDY